MGKMICRRCQILHVFYVLESRFSVLLLADPRSKAEWSVRRQRVGLLLCLQTGYCWAMKLLYQKETYKENRNRPFLYNLLMKSIKKWTSTRATCFLLICYLTAFPRSKKVKEKHEDQSAFAQFSAIFTRQALVACLVELPKWLTGILNN